MIQKKINNGREYRAFASDMAIADEEKMIVEGYAATFNQPYVLYDDGEYRVSEQISPIAFDATDTSDVIMQYDHEGRVFARNKNDTLELSVDEHGLKVRADLSGTDIGRQLYQEIKGGYTDKMSFGFTVESDEFVSEQKNGIYSELRTITAVKKLYDVSAVSIPANDATSISARKLSDGVIDKLKTERMSAIKEELRNKINLKIKIQEAISNE